MINNYTKFIIRLFKTWPFSKLEVAKFTQELITPDDRYGQCCLPKGDNINYLYTSYFFIIPFENKDKLFNSLNNLFNKYRKFSFPISNGTKKIEKYFNKFKIYHHSWHNLGIIHLPKDFKNIQHLSISIIRISESFLILTFDVYPTKVIIEEYSKLFYQSYHDVSYISIPSIRKMFVSWPVSTYPGSHGLLLKLESKITSQKHEIISFLKKNKCFFSVYDEISLIPFLALSYKKGTTNNNHIYNDFWRALGFHDSSLDLYQNDDGKFSLGKIIGTIKEDEIARVLFVNEESNTDLKAYSNLANYVSHYIRDWLTVITPIITINCLLNYIYSQINTLRNDFSTIIKKPRTYSLKKILRITISVEENIYYFNRIKIEYGKDSKIFENHRMEKFNIKFNNYNQNFIEAESYSLNNKIMNLESIIEFYHQIINRYNSLKFSITNYSIQRNIIILTFITVIIGVFQFFGKKSIYSLVEYILNKCINI